MRSPALRMAWCVPVNPACCCLQFPAQSCKNAGRNNACNRAVYVSGHWVGHTSTRPATAAVAKHPYNISISHREAGNMPRAVECARDALSVWQAGSAAAVSSSYHGCSHKGLPSREHNSRAMAMLKLARMRVGFTFFVFCVWGHEAARITSGHEGPCTSSRQFELAAATAPGKT